MVDELDKTDMSRNPNFPAIAVADPGFSPGGGRQLPKVLLFFNFLPKTA